MSLKLLSSFIVGALTSSICYSYKYLQEKAPSTSTSISTTPDDKLSQILLEKIDKLCKQVENLESFLYLLIKTPSENSQATPRETAKVSILENAPIAETKSKVNEFFSTKSRTVLVCSLCALGGFYILKFIMRRKIKFFIGDDFNEKMKTAIIDQLTKKVYFQAKFQLVSKCDADVFVVNGDLNLRGDNVVPNNNLIHLSICQNSSCPVNANEIRIKRVGTNIVMGSESIQKLFQLLDQ